MKIKVEHNCKDFQSYRAQRVKSLFNAESGATWTQEFDIEIDDLDWGVGLIVGTSGSGKTSLGRQFFGNDKLHDLYKGWDNSKPVIDCIIPNGDFNQATGALASVGLGDVPSWLRPFNALSNGQQFRAGLARLVSEAPDEVVIGITAHSFDYIGKKTRYKANIGWIGYHPSLLPRHRGRSSIEWAVRMRDAITGGTVFWLNSGIDRGDIANQDICFIDPKLYAMDSRKAAKLLWEHELQEMGLRLIKMTLTDISNGIITKKPQKKEYSTFEPNTDVKDIYKPDLLMLEQSASPST